VLVEQRETRYRVQWYHKLFESTQRGLVGAQSTEVVHGSMLALGELLRHTGEAKFRVCPEMSPQAALAHGRLFCIVLASWCIASEGISHALTLSSPSLTCDSVVF